jgi:Zn-dependent oligopeptidase
MPSPNTALRPTQNRLATLATALALACGQESTMMADPPSLGFDWHITPQHLSTRCDSAITTARAGVERALMTPAGQRTFAAAMRPIEEATENAQTDLTWLGQLYLLSPDSATRSASLACSKKATDFGVELSSDARIYAAAQEAQRDAAVTAAEDRQLVKLYIETGRRNGAGLDTVTRARVTALHTKLNDLERDFGARLAADSTTIIIADKDTAGLSPQFVATLKHTSGGFVVQVNESTVGSFMTHQRNASARERYYVAYNKRGGQDNVDRLQRALALRDTLAHLLGFQTWAAYQLDTKMAKSAPAVVQFLEDIDAALLPKAHAEVDVLATLKNQEEGNNQLRPWDRQYYGERLRQTKYALDEQVVRHYFPVDHVVPSVLDIYQALLDVKFVEVPQADAWAPGIREFRVADAKSHAWIGAFFLDLFPRPNKYDHFAAFPLHSRVSRTDGSQVAPVCAIVGNWPLPAANAPSLLSHGDVQTFFHEFGHVMHCVLGGTRYATTGPFSVRADFVEAPSQMLENWVWQPTILARISKNTETGQPLPDSLVRRIIEVRHLDDGRSWTRQAFYSLYDMALHAGTRSLDPTATWGKLSAEKSLVDMVPGTFPEASFGHLMGGYDAGYYGYLWSKVYAEDMFSRFEREGLLSTTVGRAYREQVLQPGASEEPAVLVERFLGRAMSPDAFYKSIGIAKAPGGSK